MTRRRSPNTNAQTRARRTKEYLVAGRIVRPHGVQGALILEPESDLMGLVGPGTVVYLDDASRKGRVARMQPHGSRYLLSLAGVSSREAAEALRGQRLLLDADALGPLPEGTYYRWQITGLRVLLEDGSELGSVVDVLDTGANDVYEIERADGRKILLPALSSVVQEIDLEGGILRVRLPAGLIDEA